jgi:hypothetical protein
VKAMSAHIRKKVRNSSTSLSTTILGMLLAGMGQADDEKLSGIPVSSSSRIDLRQSLAATSPAGQPLNLLLTQAELRSIVRNYEIKTGEVLTGPIAENEVIVTAPHELAPMRDVSQDAWGGIAAPFWAIMHPKDAWRIFVPVPPK